MPPTSTRREVATPVKNDAQEEKHPQKSRPKKKTASNVSNTSAETDEDAESDGETDRLIAEIKEELKKNRGLEDRTETEKRIIRGEVLEEEEDEEDDIGTAGLYLVAGTQTKMKKRSKWKLTQIDLARALAEYQLEAEAEEEK